ncbi:MAG: cardiolipin synthase [Rhodospirillales bacterium]
MQLDLTYLHFLGLALLYMAAAGCVVHAIMDTRTAQGAAAWTIGLVSFPFLALPLYLLFGRRKFSGYVTARRLSTKQLRRLETLGALPNAKEGLKSDVALGTVQVLESLATLPFTRGNGARLLRDGEATFDAILGALDDAKAYALVQFYIIRDDALGQRLARTLVAAVQRGVAVHLLYDEIGSNRTSKAYFDALAEAGVAVSSFNDSKRRFQPWQINFRNHRKIVVVDGIKAYVGGHNVGEEYLGHDPHIGPWRDTHVEVTGPIVAACQAAFYEDWYWAQDERLPLAWYYEPDKDQDRTALVLASGPADRFETCALFFTQIINAAEQRLWLVSPYFVPDQAILTALQLAALRGVDVRIMIPDKADHRLVWLAAFSYFKEAEASGIKFYRYTKGFLHQKVFLVDESLAAVGTANLDNRSLRLNFEITLLFDDRAFAGEVEAMLDEDFKHCRLYQNKEAAERSWFFRFGSRAARLAAPLL